MKKLMKAVAALMLMTAVVGCTKPDGSNNGGDNNDGTINGHAYVDLGLPSGTLWATCNVGATIPEEYGNYFAWGETSPKTNYDWSTYKYCHYVDYIVHKLTKYCNKYTAGYEGFTDDLVVLQPDDDAAKVNWGDGWYIPTREQWDELYQNTNSTWTKRNDVNGVLFVASNGKSVFMPASGYYRGENNSSVGIFGYYWSGSLFIDNSRSGYCFTSQQYADFGTSNCNYRCYGLPVRPVRSAE